MRPRTAIVLAAIAAASIGMLDSTTSAAGTDDQAIVHVLNRLGFGPRPGDVDKVRQIGIERYVEQQLHPERLPDADVTRRLAGLTTLTMSSREIVERYGKPLLDARRQRQQQPPPDRAETEPARRPAASGEQQAANTPLAELSQQKMLRAIYSERQLEEVLADFWFNHFNVDARKGPDRFLLTEYEREAIRPHVLGPFRDLLEATAKSPAMLFYLDNWMSADPKSEDRRAQGSQRRVGRGRAPFGGPGAGRPTTPTGQPQGQAANPRRGLNENYGRELMELHTLGVDGGYTQKDVTEVARAFTGWTIDNPRQGGGFRFEPRLHDSGEKTVLGHRIKSGGGMSDGERVLDILATHPSTARFLSTKLARRFVSDTPPASLVDRLAARFTATEGDLREVMRTLLTSPEFLAPESYSAKVKTPLEFVVSAVRATGAEPRDTRGLVATMRELGMPLYQCQPPTGYKDTADAWVNTGALVNRMNFAQTLAGVPSAAGRGAARETPDPLLGLRVSETTRATIAKATGAPQAMALTLGSPEFQRR